ncbi:F-box protein [Artemisia annua]|uniref:F-box protein n=1 Tax=Artemisia annua TaxID=35608 RepID=A0A2U1KN76_ARTAN|nr:F-box protein [Artemisia annua]
MRICLYYGIYANIVSPNRHHIYSNDCRTTSVEGIIYKSIVRTSVEGSGVGFKVGFNLGDAMSLKLQSHCNPISLDDLPEDLIFDILSRLPETTIIYCKCVCKRLRNLVSEIWLPKCLLIYQYQSMLMGSQSGVLKLVEIEEELDQNHLLCDPLMGIDMMKLFPGSVIRLAGSVDGLARFWVLISLISSFTPSTK